MTDKDYMRIAIEKAREGRARSGGGPFGAVIVRNGAIVCAVHNRVKGTEDLTQHAELYAIQLASQSIGRQNLKECTLYTSCEPCMMCLGACHWAAFDKIFYGASAEDARDHGFLYSHSYFNIKQHKRHSEFRMIQLLREEALKVWED